VSQRIPSRPAEFKPATRPDIKLQPAYPTAHKNSLANGRRPYKHHEHQLFETMRGAWRDFDRSRFLAAGCSAVAWRWRRALRRQRPCRRTTRRRAARRWRRLAWRWLARWRSGLVGSRLGLGMGCVVLRQSVFRLSISRILLSVCAANGGCRTDHAAGGSAKSAPGC